VDVHHCRHTDSVSRLMISPSGSAASPSGSFWAAALIVFALTIVRLVGLRFSTVDLFFDESQYWSWSHELALGYFSKPPLLAWLIAAAGHVCGQSEACIRAPAPLMSLVISLLAYAIGRTLYDVRTGFWAAMLAAFGTGSVFAARIVSTDLPLVLFWALALLAYVRLLNKPDWRWAVVLGLAMGAGLLGKYAMLYFLPALVLAAAFEKQARVLLASPELRLALVSAVIVASPNILWNAANGFVAFRYAGGNVIGEPIELSVMRPLEFLAAQFAVFGPAVFGVAIALLGRGAVASGRAVLFSPAAFAGRGPSASHAELPPPAGREREGARAPLRQGRPATTPPLIRNVRGQRPNSDLFRQAGRGEGSAKCDPHRLLPADRIVLAFGLPPLAVVVATASLVHAYANWAAAAFVPLTVLAAAILTRRNLSLLLWGSLALGIAAQIALIGADAFAARIRLPFLAQPNPYYRTLGWNAYGRTVGQLARKLRILVIASDTRAEVASLLYYWRDQPEQILAWPTTEDLPGFDLTRPLTAAAPQPVLFVSQCQDAGRLEQFYAKVTPLGIFAPDDPVPRGFAAFTLEEPRGPVGRLAPCRTG
jgi:4-amino-4-deoxy-L-arabinose transferase-like glycosyltransferase